MKVAQKSTSTVSAVAPAVNHPTEAAGLATEYFTALLKDPSSVALAGYLHDAHTTAKRDPGVEAFGKKLQEHFANMVRGVNRVGVTVHPDAFNEATARLSEAKSVLDVVGQLKDGDHDGLQEHTLQGVVLLAERLIGEAYDLLVAKYEDHDELSSD